MSLSLSNSVLSSALHFLNRLSALMHLPDPNSMVGEHFERFSIIVHGRIAEAVARQTVVVKQSKKSNDLLHFLIIVHEFAHIVRSFFHERVLFPAETKDYLHAVELGNSLLELRFPEAEFHAEQASFGGIIGVVFEDEIDRA